MEIETDPKSRRRRHIALEFCVKPRLNGIYKYIIVDFTKPPRPARFQRAMKQIPTDRSSCFSHFVHYTIVTIEMNKVLYRLCITGFGM